ncbi:MAG: OsmC family protein [Planctomycetota bacterium]|nr:OsmC family protein [Planctomycetota bacterium]
MISITAHTRGGLRVDATDGERMLVLDETAELGGTGAGLTPQQALAASLASCTAITLKLYCARKAWPLQDVRVTVTIEPASRTEPGTPNRFVQTVELVGDLDAEQRERLLGIAGKCPVHKLLEGPNVFEERLATPNGDA